MSDAIVASIIRREEGEEEGCGEGSRHDRLSSLMFLRRRRRVVVVVVVVVVVDDVFNYSSTIY
jgi:hypothetical protein